MPPVGLGIDNRGRLLGDRALLALCLRILHGRPLAAWRGSRLGRRLLRSLLLPRRGLGRRTPLWTQRLRSQQLLAVAQRHPEFPILLEAYRECLQDNFDLPGLIAVLRGTRAPILLIRPSGAPVEALAGQGDARPAEKTHPTTRTEVLR